MERKKEMGVTVFYPKETPLSAPQIETKKSNISTVGNMRIFYYKQKEVSRYYRIEIKRPAPDVVVKRREEFNKKKQELAKKLVTQLAVSSQMRGKFKQRDIDNAKQGICPKGYVLHHIIPLSLGGTNELDNLMLIEKKEHEKLHSRVWNPVRDSVPYLPEGHRDLASTYVWLIDLPRIMTPEDTYLLETLPELEARACAQKSSKKIKEGFCKSGSLNCKEGWLQAPRNCGRWGDSSRPQNGVVFSR